MAQSGYTPIKLYYSTSAGVSPSGSNLVSGELAINIADGKIFYKDSGNVVQTIASQAWTGTVTTVSVVSANGLAGTVANASTTPAITLSTSVTGLLKGNGTAISAAVSGTDYAPATSGTSILYGNGSGGFSSVTIGSGVSFVGGTLSATGSGGTVTSIAIASSNGLAGTSSGGATPTLTLSTSVTGVVKGNGTSFSAATVGTDYSAGTSALATGILKSTTSTGALTIAVSGTDYAPATSGSSILYGNGAGGFSSVTIGTGISFSAGTLSNSLPMTYPGSGIPNSTGSAWGTSYTTTGSGTVLALATSPVFTTPSLGVATATSINGLTVSTTTGTFTLTNAKTLSVTNTLTLSGTDSTTMTFPSTSQTLAGLSIAQTFTATNTFSQINYTNNPITVSANAGTVPITYRLNTFTNSSAATMAITMATASAVDGQMSIVRIYDFSAAAQTINWTNTENSTVSVPTTSNGSTTLPKTVGFMYNAATSLWRCVASA